MTPFLQLALALVIIITAAKIGGYISLRLGQPSVLGELIVGILLGPSLLDLLNLPYFTDTQLSEWVHYMAEIGVLMLMFIAGLELDLSELLRSGKVASLAGSLGVILPLALGTLTGLLFSMDVMSSVFVGLVLSATSVSISAQTLMELKVLGTRVGIGLLGAAIFDDILVLLALSVVIGLTQPDNGGLLGLLWIMVKMILFLVFASAFGYWVLPKLTRLVSRLPISQGLVTLAFIALLFFGWSAEFLGQMAAITGAFFAGVWLGRTTEKEQIHHSIATIAYGIFVPIFFINIGLSVNARALSRETLLLMMVMIVVAVAAKVLGSGLGAYWGGFTKREALQLGVGMVSRGEVGLIVSSIGISLGLIDESIFPAVLGVIITTSILTPPLLRALFPRKPKPVRIEAQASKGEST